MYGLQQICIQEVVQSKLHLRLPHTLDHTKCEMYLHDNMGHIARKPDFVACKKQRREPETEHSCSLISAFFICSLDKI